ncbi:MAG TPA: farnesyl diphosphate synthase [Longimicrobiaceae bacterium]|nr:farnesyl diphosphate synthase [Longimicrobiaceae bacterium]
MTGDLQPDSFSVAARLAHEQARVDAALAEIAAAAAARLAPALREPVEYALSTTGKRQRPILCVAALEAAGGSAGPAVYRLACALEIVHTYSLVHDDLPCMDDDDLRRGRATVHRVFGSRRAVLAGAALLPLAVQVLEEEGRALGLDLAARARLVTELCRAAGAEGMVGGQLMDLEGEEHAVDAAALEAIHRAKTGALLAASLRIGALAAGADDGTLGALTRYGEHLGLAFQIVDDVLDVIGSAEQLGKEAGRDQELRKASYPALFGVEGARALARDRAEEAKAALDGIESPRLRALADFVVERER